MAILNADLDFYYSIFIIMNPCSHQLSSVWQPPGTFYTALASPQSGIYNVTGPLFLRCANNQTSNCQPITGEDISLDFLMQNGTSFPEQVAVHPSDPAGRYYTITFAVPNLASLSFPYAIQYGLNGTITNQSDPYVSLLPLIGLKAKKSKTLKL